MLIIGQNLKQVNITYTFFYESFFLRKRASKTQNLKKMLRKSPASNISAAIFKNVDFFWSYFLVTKLTKF